MSASSSRGRGFVLMTLDGSRSLRLGVVHILRPVVIPSQMLAGWIGPARPPLPS
jgi:hypothetical protein